MKRPIGRPPGRKERITINIDPQNLKWLKRQTLSYSAIVNKLIKSMRGK